MLSSTTPGGRAGVTAKCSTVPEILGRKGVSAAPTAAFTGLGYERWLGGSVTLSTREKVRWPPRLVAVTTKIVGPLTLVGLPEMTPVE